MIEEKMLQTQAFTLDGRLQTHTKRWAYFHPGASSWPCWVCWGEQKGYICWHWKGGKKCQVLWRAKKGYSLQVSIAVSATVTDPTEDVKAMSPERRKCLLEPEISTSLYQVHHHSPFLFAELSSYPISRQSSFQNIPNLAASWRTTSRLYWTSLSMVENAIGHFFISIILKDACPTSYQKYPTMWSRSMCQDTKKATQ